MDQCIYQILMDSSNTYSVLYIQVDSGLVILLQSMQKNFL